MTNPLDILFSEADARSKEWYDNGWLWMLAIGFIIFVVWVMIRG